MKSKNKENRKLFLNYKFIKKLKNENNFKIKKETNICIKGYSSNSKSKTNNITQNELGKSEIFLKNNLSTNFSETNYKLKDYKKLYKKINEDFSNNQLNKLNNINSEINSLSILNLLKKPKKKYKSININEIYIKNKQQLFNINKTNYLKNNFLNYYKMINYIDKNLNDTLKKSNNLKQKKFIFKNNNNKLYFKKNNFIKKKKNSIKFINNTREIKNIIRNINKYNKFLKNKNKLINTEINHLNN